MTIARGLSTGLYVRSYPKNLLAFEEETLRGR